ncbi:hypothetical protein H0H92_013032 [Tricholoma furcatifolium]|nr:hypothetical protein H0H92_013032 [Tricholoma furcatifolium]
MASKAKKFKLTFHKQVAKEIAGDPTELRHKSTQYVSAHPGQVRVSTSFLSTTEKVSEQIPNQSNFTDLSYVDPVGDDGGIDPAYVQHLEEMDPDHAPTKTTAGENPMGTWLLERDRFIEELISLEGRGAYTCHRCAICLREVKEREWNGHFFEKSSLRALGLVVQLGHPRGSPCSNPIPSPGADFTVIDTNGVHSINLHFCGCGESNQLHTVQLLRSRLYPATTQNPKTATTFRALEHFELLSYLHALFLGIDANFRMKRKHVSNDARDPDIGQGFAYFVKEQPYKEYLAKNDHFVEPKSTCSRHNAVNLSNAKPGVSHAATGVGTIECARHNMKRPNAVGDLQFGESLSGRNLRMVYVSYDICCQWSIHLRERMLELDPSFFLHDDTVSIKFAVPKWHLSAHVENCRTNYSLHYTVGAARTDGEAPERGWAEVNPLASSTKEMGPGSRRDCMDAHFGDYNWRKIVVMGSTLYRKAKAAAIDAAEHAIAHDELTATLPAATVSQWIIEVEAWEQTQNHPLSSAATSSSIVNPYERKIQLPTQAAVRRKLAENEANAIASGKDVALDVNVTPSVLISMGLDLEAEQRSIKVETSAIWEHAKDRQKTKLQLRNNALSRKLTAWTDCQQLYMPAVISLRRNDSAAANSKSAPTPLHDYPLYLPSACLSKISFDRGLADIEWDLRVAQANEALEGLRRNLQIRAYLFRFKDQNVRGQHANTRARHAIDNVQAKINVCAEEYRTAQRAIVALGGFLDKVGWKHEFLQLEHADIRDVSEKQDGLSVGRSTTSWIWRVRGSEEAAENDELFRDALRMEWCKSRARAMRFAEEVELLHEEMDRVLRFLAWKETTWNSRAGYWLKGATDITPRVEGLIAYALRQAKIQADLASHFKHIWEPVAQFSADARQLIADARESPAGTSSSTES